MKKLIFTCTILLYTLYTIIAQTTIQGNLTTPKGEVLPFANIFIADSYDGATTDVDGKFKFTTDLTGNHILKAAYLGYEDFQKPIVLNNKTIQLNIVLKETFSELKAVVVTAGTFEAGDKKKAVVLKPLDIVTTAGAQGDIGNALQTLPGTTTIGESGRLFVRGGSSEETQVYIDGMHVPVSYTSSPPNISVRGKYNPFLFQGTIFNTGAYSAEYGQALSSVLLLKTHDFQEKDRLDLSFMTIGGELSGTKVWDKTALTGTVSYTNLKPYFSVVKQRNKIENPWEAWNGALSFRQKTSKTGILKVFMNANHDQSDSEAFDFTSPTNYSQFTLKNKSFYFNTSWKEMIGEKWSIFTGLSFTDDNNEQYFGNFDLSNSLKNFFFKMNTTYFFSPKMSIKFGLDHSKSNVNSKLWAANIEDQLTAGFVEADIFLSNNLVFRLGGRLGHSALFKQSKFEPRLSSALKLNKYSQISAAYGQFSQKPIDKYLGIKNNLVFRNADHYLFNYQIEKDKKLFRAEVYYKNYNKLLQYKNIYSSETYCQNGNGYATGLDIFYKDDKSIKNSKFWISYSYLISERLFQDFPSLSTPSFTAKHHGSLVYKYWINKWNSYLSGTLTYSSPRPYNNPNHTVFNDGKLKAYKSLNLSWSYLPTPKIVIYASVTNVLGFKNSFGYQFSPESNMDGIFESHEILPTADRFFFLGCFLTFSRDPSLNQLDKIE